MPIQHVFDCATGEQLEINVPDIVLPIPEVVSMRQARLALFHAGLLSQVEEAIVQLPSPDREVAQIEWNHATEVRRDNALIGQLLHYLTLTEGEVDQLFIAASVL